MITRTKIGLLVGLMVVSLASSAMADKLCLQTTVNKKTFKVTNKTVTAATCPKGYAELADTSSFQGPAGATGAQGAAGAAGATGAQGAAGGFDPNLCIKREAYKIGTGLVSQVSICEPSEILVTGACYSDASNDQSYIVEWALFPRDESRQYTSISCKIMALAGGVNAGQHQVTAQAWCCESF